MQKVSHHSYIGPDVNGKEISGMILRIAHYSSNGLPLDYAVKTDRDETGKARIAYVPAVLVAQHLDGMDLVESMRRDDE